MHEYITGAAQYPFTRLNSWENFAEKMKQWIFAGSQAAAQLLVFPEYAGMELVSLLPGHTALTLQQQLAALQRFAADFLDLHSQLARKYQVHILTGSLPLYVQGQYYNTAWFITPQGTSYAQTKNIMTRFEQEIWGISASPHPPAVVDCELGKIGIAICYDSEFPLLVRHLTDQGAEVVLVPSCTDTVSGYWRVRIACQARALENQCYVVQAPTVGQVDWCEAIDVNIGAAGVFAPPDYGFPSDGVVAAGTLNEPAWVFASVKRELLQQVRCHGQVLNNRDWRKQYKFAGKL